MQSMQVCIFDIAEEGGCPMAAEELEQNEARASQTASIIGQLEILQKECGDSSCIVGSICCQLAVSALTLLITEYRPPKRWNSITKEKGDE